MTKTGSVRLPHHEGLQHLEFRIVLRREMLAAVMVEVAAGLFLERVHQQPALEVPGLRDALDDVEVLARFLVGPAGRAGRERLEAQGRALPVARDAARMAWPLRE